MLDPSIRQVVERSERFLNTARTALEDGDPESAASRAYYALYHMTILLLHVIKGVERERWDHEQVHQAFLEQFCKPHFLFSRNEGHDWEDVKNVRIEADYGRRALSPRHAQRALRKAERLIAKMRLEVEGYENKGR